MRGKRLYAAAITAGLLLITGGWGNVLAQPLPGGTLDPASIDKYKTPLVIPPVMPETQADKYEIAVRQFKQQILPAGYPATTVWSYGSAGDPTPVVAPVANSSFNYPAYTIEAHYNKPVQVTWINDLVQNPDACADSTHPKDKACNYLPHLLPVSQTLHWANPRASGCISGDPNRTDCRTNRPTAYKGPVPIITHVHGADTYQASDGYPEAWYLPDANNIPANYATGGTLYSEFKNISPVGQQWGPGKAVFGYPNEQRATTLWYHDHTLGMTRLNVYAGPAGFYLLRGGPDGADFIDDSSTSAGNDGVLPGPAPGPGEDVNGLTANSVREKIREIPLVIQDRSFDKDGSLFYPETRAFFDGYTGPFIPGTDVPTIWNPEFFGNTMVVNGTTWPKMEVAQALYRFRVLNGSDSRFLILATDDDADNSDGVSAPVSFWQIGADGGFLPDPVEVDDLLLGPAERADVLVDFSGLADGDVVYLLNLGPDEPFGGGAPGVDFPLSDAATTGQVMKFVVNDDLNGESTTDPSGSNPATSPQNLDLPQRAPLGGATNTQYVSLNEEESGICLNAKGRFVPCTSATAVENFAPIAALLGTVDPATGTPTPLLWGDAITEEPAEGTTEIWEMYNFTEDAHPIHIHLVQFEILGREVIGGGTSVVGTNDPLPGETGTKDTVIVYPGEIARVKATFDRAGLFVWHCHILEHEDNEMMRPFCVEGDTRPSSCDVADGYMPALE